MNYLYNSIKLALFLVLILTINSNCNEIKDIYSGYESTTNEDENEDYSLDVAIKLKREFSDELVSDLFATSHGIEKIARISDLDNENSLFHFKLKNIPLESEDMKPVQYLVNKKEKRRLKRHVYNKIEMIEKDDRVLYVLPQHYLSRHKRFYILNDDEDGDNDEYDEGMSNRELDHLFRETIQEKANFKRKKHPYNFKKSDLEAIEDNLEKFYDEINSDRRSVLMEKRKNMQHLFAHHDQVFKNLTNINNSISDLPDEINFNDADFMQQWYLIDDGQFKIPLLNDLNVKNAWLNGYTGRNVTIVIVDDGLDYEHPDFLGKYRADLSYDFNDENDTLHDPMPATFDDQNNHGTRCAGAAVANANNSVCGVGVAFNAQIAGIRILDGPITDLLEARALSYKSREVFIRSASWGPKDDGSHMEYPGKLVNLALEEGVKNGRNGKGTLYIWASGNGGGNDDDCSCDGYVSHWNIISIGSVNHRGLKPYFMELCPSTMAVVYSGGQTKIKGDSDDPGVRVIASDVRGKCTKTFQGTSSAAPLAAGALALVLEANQDLTYRDVMHLIAKTSRIPNIEDTDGWILNGAGYHLNEKFGFGVLDVSRMLQEAQTWENVGEREKCEIVYEDELPQINEADKIVIGLNVNTINCPNINQLEHVIANISFSYTSRGDIKLKLVSPSGTVSEILSFRKNDKNNKGITFFPFMTLFNWGESPIGKWKLIIESRIRQDSKKVNKGALDYFSLIFYGTKSREKRDNKKRFAEQILSKAYIPSKEQVIQIYDSEIKSRRQNRIIKKSIIDDNVQLREILKNIV